MLGIIVDGPGDYASLRSRFIRHARVVKTDGPRGHTVPLNTLVSSAKKQVRLLAASGCTAVILMFDFEHRSDDYQEFMNAVDEEIDRFTFAIPIYACSPNRMIENWYLADLEEISRRRNYIRNKLRQRSFEGTHGKDELKRRMVAGVNYDEIRHGEQLFQTIRFPVAEQNSASFADFLSVLREVGIDWRAL